MKPIVLMAPNGQVGFELRRSLAPLGPVICISRNDIDFTDTAAVVDKIQAIQPVAIVNAAAWTAVDHAESANADAFTLNATLPAALATLAAKLDCWLVHYSTDYVYPGNGQSAWREEDATGPLSVYGASKLAGDLAIQQHCHRYLIFRTSWVYAARGNNFMRTMLKLAQQRDSLSVVCDQVGTPTPARLIADVTVLALQQAMQSNENKSGIYHLATRGETNWYQFAELIFTLARQHNLPLQLQPSQLHAITTLEYPSPAKRPINSRLDVSKIEQTFGLTLPDWQSQLVLTIEQYAGQMVH